MHVSISLLRAWKNAGLIGPRGTAKGHPLYLRQDLKDLKQAVYLGHVRRMNAPSLVKFLGRDGSRCGTTISVSRSIWATSSAKYAYSASRRWLMTSRRAKEAGVRVHLPGEEFLFVLSGELEIPLAGKLHRLSAGDNLYFDTSTPHPWRNPGKKETRILWINTPPTF